MNKIYFTLIFILGSVLFVNATKIKGIVEAQGKGIPNVSVTDGTNVIQTDKNGKFSLVVEKNSSYIYYSLPSGFNSPANNGIPVFFEKINHKLNSQEVRFKLYRSEKDQTNHAFVLMADPQILDNEEFELLHDVVNDINKTISNLAVKVPVHAISAGDNVFDRLNLFQDYKNIISKAGATFYHVIGNHDMDYNNRSNELSSKTYCEAFGPDHYSLNVGKVHYIMLKNVFYYGYTYRYIGYIDENQLQWIEKDIAGLTPGTTIILTYHIPSIYGESEKPESYSTLLSNELMNKSALFKILEKYKLHILAGHSHTQWTTIIDKNTIEHVHAAACGAWWQGNVCTDGTPGGYTVYEVNNDSVSWYFKGINTNETEQFRLYPVGTDLNFPRSFIANVYNFDPQWQVKWYENGKCMGNMLQYWGKDPLATSMYKPELLKKHKWITVNETHHLFRAEPINIKALIEIEVIDRFGNKYLKKLN